MSGLVGVPQGSVGVRILVVHPYGSIESSVRARRVPSGHIGHIGQSSVRSKNIKFGPKWVENRRFGPKQRPNESYGLSGPIRTTPEAKNGQKSDFSRKMAPGGWPAAPRSAMGWRGVRGRSGSSPIRCRMPSRSRAARAVAAQLQRLHPPLQVEDPHARVVGAGGEVLPLGLLLVVGRLDHERAAEAARLSGGAHAIWW